jgi:hypothetical protein
MMNLREHRVGVALRIGGFEGKRLDSIIQDLVRISMEFLSS